MIVSQNWASSPPVGAGEGIFSQMRYFGRNWARGIALPAAAMALALGGCGSMDKLTEMVPRTSDLTSFEWNPYSKASSSIPSTFRRAPLTPADYINADGSCAEVAAPEGGEPPGPTGAVALQMSECAVVRALGAPEKVDISANARGDRTAQLLYSRGDRPGLYSFTGGQLTQVERVAEPPPPPKQQKKPPAKPARRPAT
jgi:hypothetical protein